MDSLTLPPIFSDASLAPLALCYRATFDPCRATLGGEEDTVCLWVSGELSTAIERKALASADGFEQADAIFMKAYFGEIRARGLSASAGPGKTTATEQPITMRVVDVALCPKDDHAPARHSIATDARACLLAALRDVSHWAGYEEVHEGMDFGLIGFAPVSGPDRSVSQCAQMAYCSMEARALANATQSQPAPGRTKPRAL